MTRTLLLSAFSMLFLSACDLGKPVDGGRVSPIYGGPAEDPYCGSAKAIAGTTVQVDGVAQYIQRPVYAGGLGSANPDLGGAPEEANVLPIRRAEFRITSANGTIIQCGETGDNGSYSFVLPDGNVDYTFAVHSRSYNNYLRASVLVKPETNTHYKLSKTVNPSIDGGSVDFDVLAAGDGDLLGGAFNILDQLYEANEYLRLNVDCTGHTGCREVSVANPLPKVQVYWQPGFNPNSYFGGTSGLSFYLPGYSRIFILGGINGNTTTSDTDHYDNSVIIHEYGHFLEDEVFASDSPGGSHNGNGIIDPRLAWSEGWGNFLQGAVLGVAAYYDTSGNIDGSTQLIFGVNLESVVTYDVPTTAGEGNFREFSVSRLLYDAVDNTPAESHNAQLDNVTGTFDEIWAALTKTTDGFKDPAFAFRSIGHLHLAQDFLTGGTNWINLHLGHRHDPNTSQYAQLVSTTTAPCADFSITPDSTNDSGTNLSGSNLFASNDFYHLKVTTKSTYTILLTYSEGGAAQADLDLYLYNESAVFGASRDMIKYSRAEPDLPAGDAEIESVAVTLNPGNYLINVNAYTGTGYGSPGVTSYNLKLNGTQLCPDDLVQ